MRKKATRPRPEANPVTPAAADAFAMRMKHWQDALNLNDWRVERSPRPAGRNAMAEVTSMSLKARLAVYRLGSDFGENMPVTEQSVDEIACHESLHILLCELIEFARDKDTKAEDLEGVEHRVIHTLVRLLVGH
jgi:hypothetical protein